MLVQRRCFAWMRGIEQRSIKAVLTIPLADLPNGLGRKTQVGPDNRCRLPLIQLPQRQSTHHSAYRLQTATQKLIQLLAISRRKPDLKFIASAHASAIQPTMTLDKYLEWLLLHAVTVLGHNARRQ